MTTIHRQKIQRWYGNVSMKNWVDTAKKMLNVMVQRNGRKVPEKIWISNTRGGSPDGR